MEESIWRWVVCFNGKRFAVNKTKLRFEKDEKQSSQSRGKLFLILRSREK